MINKKVPRVDFLDLLRGIAIFLVFLRHTHHLIKNDFIHQFGNLFSRGVQLFHLVSGFTIYMMYIGRIHNKKQLEAYLLKKFFRVMPLFFILIPIYYLMFGLSLKFESDLPDWYHILSHYTLLFGFHPETMSSIIAPAWSIYDEFLFYIALGILFLLNVNIIQINTKIIFALFVVSFFVFIIGNVFYSEDIYFRTYLFLSPLTQMYVFFVGGACLLKNKINISKFFFLLSLVTLVFYSLFLNSTTLLVYLTVVLFSVIMLYLSQNNINYNTFF